MGYQRFLHPISTDPDIRYDDRDDIRVNLIEAYLRLTGFVQKHLPDRFMLDEAGIQRIDIRNKIFREIIANLLAHREYSSSFPAKLLIFSDIVVTENWTKPQQTGMVTLANLETHPKNPMIAKIFRELGWVEELGSGRKNIQKYAPLYFPNYKVEIQNQEKFVLSISYSNPDSDSTLQDMPAIKYEKPQSQHRLQYNSEIEALYEELVSKLGLSRDQVGTKSGLSWRQVENLLEFMETSSAIKELMELLGWSNRTKFRDKFVNPLLESGIVKMTIPDKPQSSKQQYYLSEKGKAFLTDLLNRKNYKKKNKIG
jgi:ATP-dependent DNA helicase RecG